MNDEFYRKVEDNMIVFTRPVNSDEVLYVAKGILAPRLHEAKNLTSSQATREYLSLEIGNEEREIFCCLFLNNKHQLISLERLFSGTLDGAMVHPREILKRALKHNAAAVILAHNHPSGDPEPSQADVSVTRKIKSALELVEIRLLDHIVIGNNTTTSLAERGLI